MNLKLSGVLVCKRLEKWWSLAILSGLRPDDNQTHLRAAGRSSNPLPAAMMMPQISRKQLQKTDLRPSAPLKDEEQDKRQRRD